MGCDGYADENGEFEIVICAYEKPNDHWQKQTVRGNGFKPRERLILEWKKGEGR